MKYFTLDEFDSPDVEGSGSNMDSNFLSMLDDAREMADIPFKVNSGYRTKEHNIEIYRILGKKPIDSAHLKGKAADISCSGSRERWIIVTALQDAGFNRIGIANNFIHVDSDEDKSPNVIWTY